MKVLSFLFTILFVGVFAFAGCEKPLDMSTDATHMTANSSPSLNVFTVPTTGGDLLPMTIATGITPCGTPKVVDFWAGQSIDAGSVTIYNDATNLYITVYSTYGFSQVTDNIKMWVGADLTTLPVNGQGVPVAGQFPYKVTLTTENTFTFTIPFNNIPLVNSFGSTIYIVVHGDVLASVDGVNTSTETAFGGDIGGTTGNRWWYYTTYVNQVCVVPPPPSTFDHEGTAFAKGGYVFTTDKKSNPENLPSLRLTNNRWGWAINLTSAGQYEYEIWADAGLNKTANGTKVGTLTVVYDGTAATVTYNLLTGKAIGEVHIYAGDLRPTTLAPGQYGYTAYFDPKVTTYTSNPLLVSDTNGDGIWIIAHAVAAW